MATNSACQTGITNFQLLQPASVICDHPSWEMGRIVTRIVTQIVLRLVEGEEVCVKSMAVEAIGLREWEEVVVKETIAREWSGTGAGWKGTTAEVGRFIRHDGDLCRYDWRTVFITVDRRTDVRSAVLSASVAISPSSDRLFYGSLLKLLLKLSSSLKTMIWHF